MRVARRALLALCALCALAAASQGRADGLAQLKTFVATTRSGSVAFRQTVASREGAAPREASGTFAFQRPGRFRWAYEVPYEQLIVGDGERVWVYDRDLNQVIVRRLDRALGATPAALLAGDGALEANFELSDAGRRDGLEYVEARPRTADTGFERVRIGFADGVPRAMELTDAFGKVTTLVFGPLVRTPAPSAAQFRFVPPPGADVVGEEK